MLVGRKVDGNFEDAVLSLLGEEGNYAETEVTQSSTGLLTIGYGYPLIVSFKTKAGKTAYEINPDLAADFTGIHKFSTAEISLLHKVAVDLTAGETAAALTAFESRPTNVLDFTITSSFTSSDVPNGQAQKLFQTLLTRETDAAHLQTIAASAGMSKTYELAALEDIAYQNPALISAGLRTAVSSNNRMGAWYDILTTMNPTKSNAVEQDRIEEAEYFGLYSEGSYPKNIAEAISVYRFFQTHATSLENYLVSAGETKSEALSLAEEWFGPVAGEFEAVYALDSAYVPETDVFVAPAGKSDTIHFGQGGPFPFIPEPGDGDGAVIVGGTGNDTLIISGNLANTLGEGNDIFFVSGGGKDTVNSSGLTVFETLVIDSGPGTVNVLMGEFETLRLEAPTAFKGVISGLGLSNGIDLAGIDATSATLGKGDILTIKESDGKSFSLHLAGSVDYDNYEFFFTPSADGTEMRILPKGWKEITFSEFPVDTRITTQYKKDGVIFTSQCFIDGDSADPTSPALEGGPLSNPYNGPIKAEFVDPTTGKKGTVTELSFDAGYFNTVDSTKISWYNLAGKLIGSEEDPHLGYEHFVIHSNVGIASFEVSIVGKEAAGFSFDNLAFGAVKSLA
jgi:hypothetical protein